MAKALKGRYKKNILLTGRPHVGKSTIIQRVAKGLEGGGFKNIGGFYTSEILKEGIACGVYNRYT